MAISKLRYTLFTILIVLIILVAIGTIFYFRKEQIGSKPKLIIIAMDGLKFSHIQSDSMPFITEFYKNGVYCPQLQPVFPTNTYPNLFSIATGLYPETHGVTSDIIYDNKLNKVLKFSPEMFMFKQNVTPIWTLNELAGRHSMVLWTGGEFMYRNRTPAHALPMNKSISWKQHIDDNLIPLFLRKECKVNLAMFHVKQPDLILHSHPARAKQVQDVLEDLDNMMEHLSKRLTDVGLLKITDIIILSDHGMDTFYYHPEYMEGNIIDLYRIIGRDSCDMYGSSPVLQIIARPGYDQMELCTKLKTAAAIIGHFDVYTNDDLIAKKPYWHVNNPQRFGPCTVVAEQGFVFQDIRDKLRKEHIDYVAFTPGRIFGQHGYDNYAPSMQAVFLANGPRFQHGVEIPFIQNIDLFHLFVRLLDIEQYVKKLHIDGVDRPEIWAKMLSADVMNKT